jgi:hypothetical protein
MPHVPPLFWCAFIGQVSTLQTGPVSASANVLKQDGVTLSVSVTTECPVPSAASLAQAGGYQNNGNVFTVMLRLHYYAPPGSTDTVQLAYGGAPGADMVHIHNFRAPPPPPSTPGPGVPPLPPSPPPPSPSPPPPSGAQYSTENTVWGGVTMSYKLLKMSGYGGGSDATIAQTFCEMKGHSTQTDYTITQESTSTNPCWCIYPANTPKWSTACCSGTQSLWFFQTITCA